MTREFHEGDTLLDRFELLRLLGPGGATDIWLAQDRALGERIALRILAPGLAAERSSHLRAQCGRARRLTHAAIARVYDFHEDGETFFVSREYVQGKDLETLRGAATADQLAALRPVVDALGYAHGEGIVHGDLKASKLIVGPGGGTRLLDLAIAAGLRAAADGGAQEPPTPADDTRSLGTLLHDLLAGGTIPSGLAVLVDRMLAANPDERPSEMAEVLEAFDVYAPAVAQGRAAQAGSRPVLSVDLDAAHEPALPAAAAQPGGQQRWLVWAGGAFVLGALLVFFVLPRLVTRPGPERGARSVPARPEALPPGAQAADPARLKLEAEQVLARLMAPRKRLTERAVERWAEARFAQAASAEARGDEALVRADYAAARDHYGEALALLEELEVGVAPALEAALAAGQAALLSGASAPAREQFELALVIEAEHALALHGLARAGNLDALLALMREGEALETEGEISPAHAAYTRAAELDGEWEPARAAQTRVALLIQDREFERALSSALLALADRDLVAARRELEAARALRPDSPELADGREQLRQAETQAAIAGQRRRAERAERAESWRAAERHYREALNIDPRLSFARDGAARAQRLAELTERIAELNANPTLLFGGGTLAEGRDLVVRGRESSQGRPKLAQSVATLELAVQLASTPIAVILESDGLTEVLIQKVGELGSFARREIELRPGTYVVLGRRDGYRDVRERLSIVPGRAPPRVVVSCSEQI